MLYIDNPLTDAAWNLALEQALFDGPGQTDDIFMLWQNMRAVIVGKYQNTAREINAAYVRENGVQVIRRLSGGGAVYHDLGNLNFTFITAAGDAAGLDFKLFCEPVAAALREFGINAEVSGRNDITVDGRKFSGNAQYRKNGRVMHHGTILYDSELSAVQKALRVSPDKMQDKGVRSVQSRVVNLKTLMPGEVPLADFKERLVAQMFSARGLVPRELTGAERAAAGELCRRRYATWDWNWGASPSYSVEKRRRIAGVGEVALCLLVDNGVIKEFRSYGDFFGGEQLGQLESLMIGLRLEEGRLRQALARVDIGRCYQGLSQEEFLRVLLE